MGCYGSLCVFLPIEHPYGKQVVTHICFASIMVLLFPVGKSVRLNCCFVVVASQRDAPDSVFLALFSKKT